MILSFYLEPNCLTFITLEPNEITSIHSRPSFPAYRKRGSRAGHLWPRSRDRAQLNSVQETTQVYIKFIKFIIDPTGFCYIMFAHNHPKKSPKF